MAYSLNIGALKIKINYNYANTGNNFNSISNKHRIIVFLYLLEIEFS